MIESQNVLSQVAQTAPKKLRPLLDYAEVTQQPVVIRAFGLFAGEEYGIEYSLNPSDNKWVSYSPNGAQKKITSLFNPIAVATPGRYRIVPLTTASACARFDFIAASGTHEWLLEYQEPTVVVNTTTSGGSTSVAFATRPETLSGTILDRSLNPDVLAQAIQHRGYVYAEPSGLMSSLNLALTPPIISYSNTSIIVSQLDQDSGDSPKDFFVNVNGIGSVLVKSRMGASLFPEEVPAYYTMMLLWRNDHFELLNPADFQLPFSWSFVLDPGVTIFSQNGNYFKVSNLDGSDPSASSRGIQINTLAQIAAPNNSGHVQIVLPYPSDSFGGTAFASIYLSKSVGGIVTASLAPASGALALFITPYTAGQLARPLLYSDLSPLGTIEMGFSLTYVARLF